MNKFPVAYAFVLEREGGYANHPADRGGATNRGITQRVYDAWRTERGLAPRDVRYIDDAEVGTIYHDWYWVASGADGMAWPLALVHFDSYVNHLPTTAARFLRESNGDVTKYIALREAHYHAIVARDETQRVFLRGWLNRITALKAAIGISVISVILISAIFAGILFMEAA